MNDQLYKADAGKTKPDLIALGFARALRVVQATTDYGSIKYEEHSWRTVPNAIPRYFRAAERHHQERMMIGQGQFIPVLEGADAESGICHIAHEVFNLLALMELSIDEMIGQRSQEEVIEILCAYKQPPTGHKLPVGDVQGTRHLVG